MVADKQGRVQAGSSACFGRNRAGRTEAVVSMVQKRKMTE